MQNADVEPAGHRVRVRKNVVLGHCPIGEAAAVKGDVELINTKGLLSWSQETGTRPRIARSLL
jgi:hypothetical protein